LISIPDKIRTKLIVTTLIFVTTWRQLRPEIINIKFWDPYRITELFSLFDPLLVEVDHCFKVLVLSPWLKT
jgi:hypothetical protein